MIWMVFVLIILATIFIGFFLGLGYILLTLMSYLLMIPILTQILAIELFIDSNMEVVLPLLSICLAAIPTIYHMNRQRKSDVALSEMLKYIIPGLIIVAIGSYILGNVWGTMELKHSWLQSNPNYFTTTYDCEKYVAACLNHTNPAGTSQLWIAILGTLVWYYGVFNIYGGINLHEKT